jgi:hypothetical protein
MLNENLGYYIVDNLKFSSKVDALLYSKTTNKPVQWYFHNKVFNKYNWEKEPEFNLDFYYDKRARELREKYDYIIISYSGGSDTNNIVQAFIRQNLHIDEIVTNHITKATNSFLVMDKSVTNSWNFNAEHELQAMPRLKEISEKCPNTKITILDVSDVVLNSINQFDDVDWVLKRNDHMSVGQLFRYNYLHFANIKKEFDRGKSVAIIVGLEKPKTFIIGNKFYMSFNDAVANITTINDFNVDYTNVNVEMFYWSSDTLDMMCKQAHVIKRWLEVNPQMLFAWKNKGASFKNLRLIHEKVLRPVIYTTWNDDWFQTDKSTEWWHTEFDTWFRNNKEFEGQYQKWLRGINYLGEMFSDKIHRRADGTPDSFHQFRHSYYIGEMRNDVIQF